MAVIVDGERHVSGPVHRIVLTGRLLFQATVLERRPPRRPSGADPSHAALKATITDDFRREVREQELVAANAPLPSGFISGFTRVGRGEQR